MSFSTKPRGCVGTSNNKQAQAICFDVRYSPIAYREPLNSQTAVCRRGTGVVLKPCKGDSPDPQFSYFWEWMNLGFNCTVVTSSLFLPGKRFLFFTFPSPLLRFFWSVSSLSTYLLAMLGAAVNHASIRFNQSIIGNNDRDVCRRAAPFHCGLRRRVVRFFTCRVKLDEFCSLAFRLRKLISA